jgi:hypothetical protein
MQMRNNKGELVAEQNVGVTKEGNVVSTILGGKLLP